MKGYSNYLYSLQFRRKNPEKIKAHRAVYVAVRNGTLKKTPCIECNEPKSEAHHEDYYKPLEVIWLCRKHHREYDLALKNKGN